MTLTRQHENYETYLGYSRLGSFDIAEIDWIVTMHCAMLLHIKGDGMAHETVTQASDQLIYGPETFDGWTASLWDYYEQLPPYEERLAQLEAQLDEPVIVGQPTTYRDIVEASQPQHDNDSPVPRHLHETEDQSLILTIREAHLSRLRELYGGSRSERDAGKPLAPRTYAHNGWQKGIYGDDGPFYDMFELRMYDAYNGWDTTSPVIDGVEWFRVIGVIAQNRPAMVCIPFARSIEEGGSPFPKVYVMGEDYPGSWRTLHTSREHATYEFVPMLFPEDWSTEKNTRFGERPYSFETVFGPEPQD